MKHIALIALLSTFYCIGQYRSPFTNKEWKNDSTGNYSFIVSGHFYGGGTNQSGYPANTLLANLDWINESGAAALICLGDLFKSVADDRALYTQSLFSKLEMPLVNTVGNHDLTGTIYQENYGETSFMIEVNGDLHVVIDTERDNGDLKADQLTLLKTAKKKVKENGINNVFIYGHRTIWKDAYPEMEGLFEDNTQGLTAPNFEDDVLPELKEIGEEANVFWFSGSLGTAPASFFYFDDQKNGLKIIATAIRALPRDAVLVVHVNGGEVRFETHSLTGEKVNDLESYTVDFWKGTDAEPSFNWRLAPYYIELMLTHRYFWYGVGYSTAGLLLLYWFLRRRKRKKEAHS